MITNKKALIIDDSRTACLVLSRQLEKLGIMSDSVYSAQSALDYLIDDRPDVIFLDHSMPGMDGFEAIKVMKSDPATSTIPVIMYTSNSGDLFLSQARALGALDVINKNMESGIIAKTLKKLGLIAKQESIQSQIDTTEKELNSDTSLDLTQKNISDLEKNLQRKLSIILNQQLSTMQRSLEDNIEYKHKKSINRSSKHVIEENKSQNQKNSEILQQEIALASKNIQKQSYTQEKKIKWLSYISALQLIMIIALISFQLSSPRYAFINDQAIKKIQINTDKQNSLLNQIIENQQNSNDYTSMETDEPSDNRERFTPFIESIYLNNVNGLPIGKVLSFSPENGKLNIMNTNGFLFQIDPDHKITSELPKQFFRDQSCFGAGYVKSHKGMIFVDAENALWFTDVHAKDESVIPSSFLFKGKCKEYYGEHLQLIDLLPNQPSITGVDSYDFSTNQ
ncbi:MAG: response regulator [Methylococcales bacterium]|nr:response regulator [Methylococcales bacterium]